MLEAGEARAWQAAMADPVPRLQAVELPDDVTRVREWAARHEQDAATLRHLVEHYEGGRIARPDGRPARLLAAAPALPGTADAATPPGAAGGSH